MKRTQKWLALCCLVALLGVSGCSNDDENTPPLNAASVQPVVQAAMTQVVVPMVTVVGVLATVTTAAQARAAQPRGAICDPAVNCSQGGTYQICPTGATFTTCGEAGAVLDGAVTVTDPLTLTVAFNLDISGTTLVGPAQLHDVYTCGPGITFNDLTATADDVTANVNGTLELCALVSGTALPTGTLNTTCMSSGLTADVDLTFNGTPIVYAVVTDPSSGTVVATCSVGLLPSVTTTCYDPEH